MNLKIDIDSPLFEIISKTKNFENNYTIYISQKYFDEFKLKEQYIQFFNKLNKLDVKYSSIYYEFYCHKISFLKDLNIDFNKIKRISLNEKDDGIYDYLLDKSNFFETFFSFNNIEDNLIYLKIFYTKIVNIIPFENINNFKSSQYLYIDLLRFEKVLTIKINNLITLSCNDIGNVNVLE